MEVTPAFDWKLWEHRNLRAEQASRQRTEDKVREALTTVRDIATKFVSLDPQLRRIVLFGSIARQDPRSEDFDLDISVEGAQRFGVLFAEAERCPFPVDLVEWEGLKSQIQFHIREEGIVLYERN